MPDKLLLHDVSKRQEHRKMLMPTLLYMTVYLLWWGTLERQGSTQMTVIHMTLDDYIPFAEVFVVPYLFWFVYCIGGVLYFWWHTDKEDYYRLILFLFSGMTVFLLVSTFFPNVHELRPRSFARSNVFTALIGLLYRIDTPTNLWPSIHVYNSIGIHLAVMRSKRLRAYPFVRRASFVCCVLIILSTMFIKQHSAFDVLTGCAMSIVTGTFVYRTELVDRLFRKRMVRDEGRQEG